MIISYKNIIRFFRYLWLILAFSLILYILSNNIITKRELSYHLDFSQNISQDTRGWYPESRGRYFSGENEFFVKKEPIYLQVYMPIRFDTLTIKGGVRFDTETLNLGLKQKDGSWFWQNISEQDFDLEFPLKDAQNKANKLEIILSIPDLNESSGVYLKNNWEINFKR